MATTKVVDVIRVSPSTLSESTDSSAREYSTTLTLTFFDTLWLKFPPVERLYFYQVDDLTRHLFQSVVLPRLTASLSLALFHHLPLSGKIRLPPEAPKPDVYYYSDDSLSVTVAESDADFDHLSGDQIHEADDLRPLTPELPTSDEFADLIAVQITLFPNKGFSIGVSTHHAIFDGKSSTSFVKSWAYLCKSPPPPPQDDSSSTPSLPPELTPSFDRTVIKDQTGAAVSFMEKWFGLGGDVRSEPGSRSLKVLPHFGSVQSLVRATFELTRDDLKRLRDKLHEYQVRETKELHLSTFVLTCAYVFSCMVKARGGDPDREVVFGFTADYRARLDPPVPANYFGNCVGSHMTFTKAGDYMEEKGGGVAVAAEKLSEAIKALDEKGIVEKLQEIFELGGSFKPGIQLLGTAGSNRFGVYRTDFGWGTPKKVEIVSIDRTAAVSLADSRRGDGGVEVGVVLDKQEMETFASLFYQGLNFVQSQV